MGLRGLPCFGKQQSGLQLVLEDAFLLSQTRPHRDLRFLAYNVAKVQVVVLCRCGMAGSSGRADVARDLRAVPSEAEAAGSSAQVLLSSMSMH